MTQHANASELIFLRPKEEIIDKVQNMFSDYMHTTLLPEFDDRQIILDLKGQLSSHPLYESQLEELLDHALSVIDGTLNVDPVNRQFTADPKSRGRLIQQRGDLIDYGHDLHFMFNLTNYLPTGIFGNTGEQITIYVDPDQGGETPDQGGENTPAETPEQDAIIIVIAAVIVVIAICAAAVTIVIVKKHKVANK